MLEKINEADETRYKDDVCDLVKLGMHAHLVGSLVLHISGVWHPIFFRSADTSAMIASII